VKPTPCVFDISHHNPLPSATYAGDDPLFAQAKGAGWIAVLHKLTQGAMFVDPVALGRIASAARVGLLTGGYHYLTDEPLAVQVANFMHVVGQARAVSPSFVCMLDFEPTAASADSTRMADQFVSAVRSVTGRWPLLYTGRWDVSPETVATTSLPACPLMLSEYGTNPVCPIGWVNWNIHQYSDGKVGPTPVSIPGIGYVDQSVFAGSRDELPAWWTTNGGA
jgi:GH25 family lysozyme M1 (1,4-beta-N-acetylmuramidase)